MLKGTHAPAVYGYIASVPYDVQHGTGVAH